MKLNPDCIRNLLFAIEEKSTVNSLMTSEQLSKSSFISNYSKDEILYHLKQLNLSGYIIAPQRALLDNIYLVNDLSPLGHEFLSNIRQDTNWNKVKSISKEVGSETLSSIKNIAETVISSAIANICGFH